MVRSEAHQIMPWRASLPAAAVIERDVSRGGDGESEDSPLLLLCHMLIEIEEMSNSV